MVIACNPSAPAAGERLAGGDPIAAQGTRDGLVLGADLTQPAGIVVMLIAQWTTVASRTPKQPVSEYSFATDVAKLLLNGVLDDNVTARIIAIADSDGGINGSVSLALDGTITFIPDPDYSGLQ